MEEQMTRAKAEKRTYGYGINGNTPYAPEWCVETVTGSGGYNFHQCSRPPGFGPDGLYCKQHDPVAKKAKSDARYKKYEEQASRKRAAIAENQERLRAEGRAEVQRLFAKWADDGGCGCQRCDDNSCSLAIQLVSDGHGTVFAVCAQCAAEHFNAAQPKEKSE